MKKNRLSAILSLLFVSYGLTYGQSVVNDPMAMEQRASIAAQQIQSQIDQLDNSIQILDIFRQNKDVTQLMLKGASAIKSSPMLAEVIATADRLYNTYESNLNYMQRASNFGTVQSYSDLKARLSNMASIITQTSEDIDFIVSFIVKVGENWNATEAERISILENIKEKLNERESALEHEFLKWYYFNFVEGATLPAVEAITSGAMFNELANTSVETLRNRAKKAIKQNGGISTAEVEKEGSVIKATFKSTGIKFGAIVIIVLSILYVPFNIYKVNLNERSSNDAVIRIIMGVFLGLVFLGIISFL